MILLTHQKRLAFDKRHSRSFHARSIPRCSRFSLSFVTNASFGGSSHSRSRAPCIRLVYHSVDAYALSNRHLGLLNSWNHHSILLFVRLWIILLHGIGFDASHTRYRSTATDTFTLEDSHASSEGSVKHS
jgi:hypothetical protein